MHELVTIWKTTQVKIMPQGFVVAHSKKLLAHTSYGVEQNGKITKLQNMEEQEIVQAKILVTPSFHNIVTR